MEVISQSSFSTRLRQAMKDSGLNQAELASLSGLSEGLISGLVNNQRKDLRASSLIAISYALDKDPLELYWVISIPIVELHMYGVFKISITINQMQSPLSLVKSGSRATNCRSLCLQSK